MNSTENSTRQDTHNFKIQNLQRSLQNLQKRIKPFHIDYVLVKMLFCRDAMLIAVMDVVTSLIAGFVIFTTFGGMAKNIGVEVQDVAKSGKILHRRNVTYMLMVIIGKEL